jgi:hypothetical protein
MTTQQQPQNTEKEAQNTEKQGNIGNHSQTVFDDVIIDALSTGGLNACAFKNHGKTRFLMSICTELMKSDSIRCLIWDSSDAWLYGFNQIPTFNVCDNDISAKERKTSEDLEKYQLNNWLLIKFALDHNKDLLFRMKTRNPQKRAFFVRAVINYLDTLQRDEKEASPTHENKQAIAFFLEEAQNIFSSRTTSSNDMAEFLSVFNEGRNFKESFWTACQRNFDLSKTIRTKQLQIIGKLSSEDLSPSFRKLEKKLKIDFANMQARTWLYNETLFISPEFKQAGKPVIINRSNREAWQDSLPKKPQKTLMQKIGQWLKNRIVDPTDAKTLTNLGNDSEDSEQKEDSESDGLMTLDDDDILFPS